MINDPNGQATLESMSQAVWYNQWILAKLTPYIKGEILEVGCGIGNFTKELVNFGQVTAIDIEEGYIPNVKKAQDKVTVGIGDIEKGKYFFGSKKFDTIICLNVLEHIKNDEEALDNMIRLLKPNGYLILLVPSGMNLYGSIDLSIGHFRRYSKADLVERLKKRDLDVIYSRRLNFLGGLGWWFAGRVLKTKTVQKNQIWLFNFFAPILLRIENFFEPAFGTSVLTISQKR